MDKEGLENISLVDVHAHLDELDDLSDALEEAKAAKVKVIIAVGVDKKSNRRILQIAKENQKFTFSVCKIKS